MWLTKCSVTSSVLWMLHLLLEVCTKETAQPGWIPSTIFANYSQVKYPVQNVSTTKIKSPAGRAYQDNRIDSVGFDYPSDDPFIPPDSSGVPFIPADSSASSYFPAQYKPGSASSYISSSSGSYSYPSSGYTYSGSSYLPPSPSYSAPSPSYSAPSSYFPPPSSSSQYIPTFDVSNTYLYGPDQSQNTSNNLVSSVKKHLYVQPGQCSNSVQVQRVKDIEVQTSLTFGTTVKQGVCVLMLYGANEYNKLALSLYFPNTSTGVIPSDTWLENNLQVYTVQTGLITFLNTS